MKELQEFFGNHVMIIQTKRISYNYNEGRFSESQYGFTIEQPLVGFVNKDFWEQIRAFQKLDTSKISNDDVFNLLKVAGDDLKITSLESLKWKDLINKNDIFQSQIVEFNIITGISIDRSKFCRRTFMEIGKDLWREVSSNEKEWFKFERI